MVIVTVTRCQRETCELPKEPWTHHIKLVASYPYSSNGYTTLVATNCCGKVNTSNETPSRRLNVDRPRVTRYEQEIVSFSPSPQTQSLESAFWSNATTRRLNSILPSTRVFSICCRLSSTAHADRRPASHTALPRQHHADQAQQPLLRSTSAN